MRQSAPDMYIKEAGHQFQPSSCVRSLGVVFDCNMKMEQLIANTVKIIRSETLSQFAQN